MLKCNLLKPTHWYSTNNKVSKKVDMNVKTAVSPEGGFSGTSGKQNPTHVCISASENWPFRRSVFAGRVSSNLCVLMCNESGLIW